MARAQNEIGWRRYMEGMICKEIGWIQRMQVGLQASQLSAETWRWNGNRSWGRQGLYHNIS